MENRFFLAVHELPPGAERHPLEEALQRVSVVAHDHGVHPVETFYSMETRRGYTIFQAGKPEDVRGVLEDVGLAPLDILRGDRIFTDLLDEPRRNR